MKRTRDKKVMLESLASMVANGFAEQEKKITENLTAEIKGVETRLSQ